MASPFPATLGLGSAGPHHHPGDAAPRMARCRGLAALVAAGLQGDIHGGPGGVLGAGGQAARSAWRSPHGRGTLADDLAVLDDHGPHHGVGAGPPGAFLGQEESLGHIFLVGHSDTIRKSAPEPNLQSASRQAQVSRVFPHEKLWNDTIPEHTSTENRRGDPAYCFTHLLPSRLYCRFWNCTKSLLLLTADCTADREFSPLP